MVGCAFVEYKKVLEATKALKNLNASQLLGRTIAVDWAVPKEVFNPQKDGPKDEIKEEDMKEEIKEEPEDDESERVAEWKKEEEENESDESDEDEDDDDEEGSEEEDEDNKHDLSSENIKEKKAHNLKAGHDVNEGKTIFIRNLSYDSEEEDLKALME